MTKLMKETLKRLKEITKNCNVDMHEPDNQNVTAVTTGHIFDNAMGDIPYHNSSEMTVGITVTHDFEGGGHSTDIEWFNLATLVALARMAKIE